MWEIAGLITRRSLVQIQVAPKQTQHQLGLFWGAKASQQFGLRLDLK